MPVEGLSIPYDSSQQMKKMATGATGAVEIQASLDLIPWLAGNEHISFAESRMAQNEMMGTTDANTNFEADLQEASEVEYEYSEDEEEHEEEGTGDAMDIDSSICRFAQQQQDQTAMVNYYYNASNVVLPDMALDTYNPENAANTMAFDAAEFATLQQEFMLPGMMEEDWDIWLASLATQQSSLPSESTSVTTTATSATTTAAVPMADEVLPTPTSTSFSTISCVSWPCSGSPTSTINTMEPMTPNTPSKRMNMSTLSQLQQYSDHREERHSQLHLPQDVVSVTTQEKDKKPEETHFPEFKSDEHLHTLDDVSCFECGWSTIPASLASRKHRRKSRVSAVQEEVNCQKDQTRDKRRELLEHPALRNKAGCKHLCSQCIETKEEYKLMNATEASKVYRLKRKGGSQMLQQLPFVRHRNCKMFWVNHLQLLYDHLATVREAKEKEKVDRIKTGKVQEELPLVDDLVERGPEPKKKEVSRILKISDQTGSESSDAAGISKSLTVPSSGVLAPHTLADRHTSSDKLNELADAALCGLEHSGTSQHAQQEAHNDMSMSSDEFRKDRNDLYNDDDNITATLAETPYLSYLRSVGLEGVSHSCTEFSQPLPPDKADLEGTPSATVLAHVIRSAQEGDAMAMEENEDDDEETTSSEEEDDEEERGGQVEEDDDEEVIAILSPADNKAQGQEYKAQRKTELDQLRQEVRLEYLFRAVRHLCPDPPASESSASCSGEQKHLRALTDAEDLDHDEMMNWMKEMTSEKQREAIQVFVAGQWKQLVQQCGWKIGPGDYEGMANYLVFGQRENIDTSK